ncbi:MAG: hypothetical protein REJ23_03120 [Brevundimonas sp.]|nr:hypothetical protein [Brevundimonas sp.]
MFDEAFAILVGRCLHRTPAAPRGHMFPLSLIVLIPALAQEPPPMPPPGPGRPPPLANGIAITGRLGSDCGDLRDPTGRWRHQSWASLGAGQRIWLSVSSPDFDVTLNVHDADGKPVATVEDQQDDRPTGQFIVATSDEATNGALQTYSLQVTSAEPGQTGRWRIEDRRDGSDAQMFHGEILPLSGSSDCSVEAGSDHGPD